MAHVSDSCVVCCIDFRFQKHIRKFADEYLKNKTFDLIGFAGASKSLDIILGQLDISVRLHQIKQVVLIHHEECGAYGAESTLERHAEDLKKAKNAILAKWPNLQVGLFYMKLDGKVEKVI
jgi:carbonic anhydrase